MRKEIISYMSDDVKTTYEGFLRNVQRAGERLPSVVAGRGGVLPIIGNLSNDDGDGYENVT